MVDKNDGTGDRKRFMVCDRCTINAFFFTPKIVVCYLHRKRHRDGEGRGDYTAGCPMVFALSLFTHLEIVGANRKGTFVLQIVSFERFAFSCSCLPSKTIHILTFIRRIINYCLNCAPGAYQCWSTNSVRVFKRMISFHIRFIEDVFNRSFCTFRRRR